MEEKPATEAMDRTRSSLKRPYPSIAVANEFIRLGLDAKRPISPMKLQKLCFFAHGWRLEVAGIPLVDEEFQAWKLGPVMSGVYHEFKIWRDQPIIELGESFEPDFKDGEIIGFTVVKPFVDEDDPGTKRLIHENWQHYGDFEAITLSNMTHQDGGAWSRVWNHTAKRSGMKAVGISNSKIRDEFDLRADASPELCERFRSAVRG